MPQMPIAGDPRTFHSKQGISCYPVLHHPRSALEGIDFKLHASQPEPISVIIVNHNAGTLLSSCVLAALQQTREVIVIDNASSDSSLIELQSKLPNNKQAHIITLDHNVGFAAGCNLGIVHATQPYLLFLNPDCIMEQGSLTRLLQALRSEPRIGMAGGLLTNPDGSEQGGGRRAIPTPWRALVRAAGFYRLEKFHPHLFFDFHLNKQPLPATSVEVEAISGALMLVRREAISDVGNWDEGYFLHCEDLDWCMRFQQKNWKILFVPDAPVIHYQGTCSQARPYFVAWHKHKGMLRFYRKFFRDQYPGVLMGLITLGVWLRFAVTVGYHGIRDCFNLLNPKHG